MQKVRRILVTGNAGSGKTTLARKIASQLALPYHSLDTIVWQPGWKKTPQDEKTQKVQKLISQESWIIDGVSFDAQSEADVVIFLDVPRRVSFFRVACRNWRFLFQSRPELPANCPEILIIPALVKIIWKFSANIKPRILKMASEMKDPHHFFQIQNLKDQERCIEILVRTLTLPPAPVGQSRSA